MESHMETYSALKATDGSIANYNKYIAQIISDFTKNNTTFV